MNKNKILLTIMVLFSSFALSLNKSYAETLPLFANTAIAIEASTGQVLYEKNAREKMYPASTTKLWTAYLVIKNTEDLNKKITVQSDLSWVEPSSMYLKVGETFTVRELLEVLMLKSANDVAVLLAIETSGSVEEFAKLMNEEAKAIGCYDTNFINPNGLPDDNHYSTAYDMALMARESLKSDVLREIVKKEEIRLPANEFYPYERVYRNSNKFLTGEGQMPYNGSFVDYKYDIVDGLKTGYTSVAGRCLMTTAELNGTRVITGVFNSKGDDVYTDSRVLIDYSLANYKTRSVVKNEQLEPELQKEVPLSKEKKVQGYIKEDFNVVEENKVEKTRTMKEDYNYKVKLNSKIAPPVIKDEVIGKVEVYNSNKEKVKELDVYASDEVHAIFDSEQLILLTVGISLITIISIRRIRRKRKINNGRENNIYKKANNSQFKQIDENE